MQIFELIIENSMNITQTSPVFVLFSIINNLKICVVFCKILDDFFVQNDLTYLHVCRGYITYRRTHYIILLFFFVFRRKMDEVSLCIDIA